jgi:hypothetical protein
MPPDESTPPQRRALSPEEVGARVSAILEAAECDARAVIDAAHRSAAESTEELTLEHIAARLDALSVRVAALECGLGASAPAEPPPTPPQREEAPERSVEARPAAAPTAATRVRAIELALSGYPRAAIARELASSMAPGDVDALLDEVLAPQ